MLHNDDNSIDPIYKLYCDIDRYLCCDIRYTGNGKELKNLQDLQKRLRQEQEINLLKKHENQTLGGGVLNLAVEWNNPHVVEFLLQNINKEQSKHDFNSKKYEEYQALVNEAVSIAAEENKEGKRAEIVQLFVKYGKVSNESERLSAPNAQKNNDSSGSSKVKSQKNKSKDFYTALGQDGIAVISTGALIAISIMQPSDALKAVFGVLAVLVAIGTGLHIQNYTIPSYVEMQGNSVKYVRTLDNLKL